MSTALDERAALEQQIAGRTLCTELEHTAAKSRPSTALPVQLSGVRHSSQPGPQTFRSKFFANSRRSLARSAS